MRGTPMERSQTVNLASRAIMSIVVCAWLFSTTIACQNATHQLHESDCEKIDPRLEGPDLLDRFDRFRENKGKTVSNPDLYPPGMPIWVIQVKGRSKSVRPEGWETFNYDYAIAAINASSGEIVGQSYLLDPLLIP